MTVEHRHFAVTIPAGTTAAAPQTTALTMPARVPRSVRIRVPPGPKGEVGFALASSGTPIIPWNAGAWLVLDDEVIDWPLDGQIDSGAWQLRGYNTGRFDHTIYLSFVLDPLPGRGALGTVTQPLSLEA